MKYSIEESLARIEMRRADKVRKKAKRTIRLFAATSIILFCTLSAALYQLTGSGAGAGTESVYGSYLLSQDAGGYVLVAVISFTLGVAVSVLIYHKRKKDRIHNLEDLRKNDP